MDKFIYAAPQVLDCEIAAVSGEEGVGENSCFVDCSTDSFCPSSVDEF